MATHMDDTILYLFGSQIQCRRNLASLCRVSKAFNDFFSPRLYHSIKQNKLSSWTKLSQHSTEKNLKCIKKLDTTYMGAGSGTLPRHPQIAEALSAVLCKVPNLEFLRFDAWPLDDETESTYEKTRLSSLLQTVAEAGSLRSLKFQSYCRREEIELHLPLFSNLEELSIKNVSIQNSFRNHDIVDILLASPKLQTLSLANIPWYDHENQTLEDLCTEYHSLRQARQLPRLRIKSLTLSFGYYSETAVHSTGNGGYLMKLTDLKYLKSLDLFTPPGRAGPAEPERDPERILVVDISLFISATNITHIAVSRMTQDIVNLISYVRGANSEAMTSLRVAGVNVEYETTVTIGSGFGAADGIAGSEVKLDLAGFHWKTIEIIDGRFGQESFWLPNFVSKCKNLENFTCPAQERHGRPGSESYQPDSEFIQNLKMLPALTKLQTLSLEDIWMVWSLDYTTEWVGGKRKRRMTAKERASKRGQAIMIEELLKQKKDLVQEFFDASFSTDSDKEEGPWLKRMVLPRRDYGGIWVCRLNEQQDGSKRWEVLRLVESVEDPCLCCPRPE